MFTEIKIGLAILAAVTTIGSCTVAKRIDADRDKWRENARQWKANSATWKGRYTAEAAQRGEDHRNAVEAVSAVESACAARVKAARQSEAAIRRLVARPVKVDAKGCPAPAIWRESDLRPSLRPEVR